MQVKNKYWALRWTDLSSRGVLQSTRARVYITGPPETLKWVAGNLLTKINMAHTQIPSVI